MSQRYPLPLTPRLYYVHVHPRHLVAIALLKLIVRASFQKKQGAAQAPGRRSYGDLGCVGVHMRLNVHSILRVLPRAGGRREPLQAGDILIPVFAGSNQRSPEYTRYPYVGRHHCTPRRK